MLTNRSNLRRFSDREFAQFVSTCFSGGEECGHNSAAFSVLYWRICAEIADQRVLRLRLRRAETYPGYVPRLLRPARS